VGECIDALDCFNNGGRFDDAACRPTAGRSCHDAALPPCAVLALPNCARSDSCSGKQGPAGSTGACQGARSNACTVIGTGEGDCACDADPTALENPICP
jgi:hypothetical protein